MRSEHICKYPSIHFFLLLSYQAYQDIIGCDGLVNNSNAKQITVCKLSLGLRKFCVSTYSQQKTKAGSNHKVVIRSPFAFKQRDFSQKKRYSVTDNNASCRQVVVLATVIPSFLNGT